MDDRMYVLMYARMYVRMDFRMDVRMDVHMDYLLMSKHVHRGALLIKTIPFCTSIKNMTSYFEVLKQKRHSL